MDSGVDSARRSASHGAAIGFALFVTFLWSTSWIVIRWGLDDEGLPPLTFAALRYSLAAVVLLGWIASQSDYRESLRRLDRSALTGIVGLGMIMYAITQGAQFVAIDSQPAATSSLVLSGTPLVVAFLGARALKERPTFRQLVGAVLVITGAAVYFSGSLSATAVGLVAAFVGLVANSFGAVLGRGVNRSASVPVVVVTGLSMAVGAATLLLVAGLIDGLPAVSARAWVMIAWLAVVNTALAFTLWNLSLRRLTALESAAINNTMLLQIGLLAWWLLDEYPGPLGFAGIGLASIGILLAQTSRSQLHRG